MFKSLFQAVVAGCIAVLLSSCGPSIKDFEGLKEPRITTMQAQKVIVTELKGTPEETSGKAIGALYKMYFSLKGVKGMVAPRARWPMPAGKPQNEWVGRFALPVPDAIEKLPEQKEKKDIEIKISTWKYGQVAEVLYVGPYDQETATIEKLHKFIKDSGYRIAGEHEEEYVKGPGMFFKGNPRNYLTIIRYQVAKEVLSGKKKATSKSKKK